MGTTTVVTYSSYLLTSAELGTHTGQQPGNQLLTQVFCYRGSLAPGSCL